MNIAIIGGTGDMGYGLALRLAKAGHRVIIGSRTAERAEEAAKAARETTGSATVSGAENAQAVAQAELVILSVPSAGHRATVESLREALTGKPVLDITVPLAFKPLRYAPPAEGSNALETAAILGEGCRLASGLHTISATLLSDLEHPVEANALVVGNDQELKDTVLNLSREIGITAYDAGTLNLSCALESQTPMLIGMNKRYGSKHIGLHLIGFPGEE